MLLTRPASPPPTEVDPTADHHDLAEPQSRFRPAPRVGPPLPPPAFKLPFLPVLTLVGAYVLGLSWIMVDCFMDDAYIGFRYVNNLVAGNGLVFNVGQRVEGITNIAWALFLAPFAYMLPVTFVAKFWGALLVIATAVACGWIAFRFVRSDRDEVFALPIPFLVIAFPDFIFFSLSGMETPLLAGLMCLMVVLGFRNSRSITLGLLGGLLFLVHPEALLFYPLALLLLNGTHASAWRNYRRPLVAFAAMVTVCTCLRFAYFGSLVPNTFFAKSTSAHGVLERLLLMLQGSNANIPYPFVGLLALPFLLAGILGLWRKHTAPAAFLTSGLLVGMIFAVYSGQDWTGMARYFAPYAPLGLIIFWKGFVDLNRRLFAHLFLPRLVNVPVGTLAYVLVLLGLLGTLEPLRATNAGSYPGYVMTSSTLVGPARWLNTMLPPEAVVATRRIGAVGYYGQCDVFDYAFGLTDPEVAHLIAKRGYAISNPCDPVLRQRWQQVCPDYLLEDRDIIDEIVASGDGSPQLFEIHGLYYRVEHSFRIGHETDWTLCQRVPLDPLPPLAQAGRIRAVNQ